MVVVIVLVVVMLLVLVLIVIVRGRWARHWAAIGPHNHQRIPFMLALSVPSKFTMLL